MRRPPEAIQPSAFALDQATTAEVADDHADGHAADQVDERGDAREPRRSPR